MHPGFRVGLIAYGQERPGGGINRYTRALLESLLALGVIPAVLETAASVYDDPARGWSGPVERLRGSALLPGLLTWGQVQVAAAARRLNLDVLHDPSGTLPILLSAVPAIATIHDTIPYVQPRSSTLLDWLIQHCWLPLAVPRLSHVITVSHQSSQDLQRWLAIPARKITVIPLAAETRFHPVPEAQYQPILKRHGLEQPFILYVGSVEPRKNLLRLLQAYQRLRQWSTRWSLVIVGARNLWKSSPVARFTQNNDLQGCVRFTGYVADADLPALYSAADLFVFPSLYEGFGLPVLEAMACGTPVVTANTASLPEVAGEAALLVDPYNVEALAEAMQKVLSDHELALDLRRRGFERAAQFTWERTARLTISVYQQVLEASRSVSGRTKESE
jgi:glycosyltransferase involved in cell wall biosynthesis